MERRKGPGVSADVIDSNLKEIFQSEVERELPDRFKDLIEKLRSGSGTDDDAKSEDHK